MVFKSLFLVGFFAGLAFCDTGTMPVRIVQPSAVSIECPRSLRISTSVTLSGSTTETVVLSSGATGVFNDPYLVLVNNTSATASRVDFRSKGNGTAIDFAVYVPAGDVRGFTAPVQWPQGTSAANWTVQSSASVTDIRVMMSFCKNK